MIKKFIILITAMLLLFLPIVFSDTMQLQGADFENLADLRVDSNFGGVNYDTATNIVLEDSNPPFIRIYIMFANNYSNPIIDTITNASIWLNAYGGGGVIDLRTYCINATAGWDESEVVWDYQPCGVAIDNAENCSLTPSTWIISADNGFKQYADVTDCVNRAKTEGWANVSFMIATQESGSGSYSNIRSKEYATPSDRPILNITYTTSELPSIVSTAINNTTPKENDDVQISIHTTDAVGLGAITLANNISGWANFSLTNTSGVTDINYSVNFTNGATYPFVVGNIFTVNDTSGNSVQSSIITYTVFKDVTLPTITALSINISLPYYDNDVLVSALLNDETELDWWRIAHNQSGTMTNQTINDISGVSLNATYLFSDAITKGNVIEYQFWTNDTTNNAETSAVNTFTVINTAPETPTIIYPTADLRTNIQPENLQVTFPADADGDIETIYYYINDTLNTTSLTNVTFEASDGIYQLKVSITDGEVFSANDSVLFEIDTVFPILTITNPIVTTYNTNIDVNISCSDLSPFLLNYTLYNTTGTVKSIQEDTPIGNVLSIDDIINISTLAPISYNLTAVCSDSHTVYEIKEGEEYYITYTSNSIMYDTFEGNRIKIVQVGQPSNPSSPKKKDRYEFNFGSVEVGEQRTYKVISTWNDVIVVEDSEYNAHLVVWNKDIQKGNWVDFESSDAQIISIERINPRHVEVVVQATDFNFKSIGGLNVVEDSILFTIQAVEVEEEEDAVLSAVLLVGGIAILITVVIMMLITVLKSARGKK